MVHGVKHVILTPRQLQVAKLLSRGLTYEDIGEHLQISPRTVEHHAAELRRKTNSPNNVAAVSRAQARGLGARSAS
jgi:DNA-binding CsgD family transcriptional regulator